MRSIPSFDPSTALNGILETNGINIGEQLMLYNDSAYGLSLAFGDGSVDIIPPFWNKDFILEHVAMGKVTWTIYNGLTSTTGWPISQCYGTIYEKSERVASVNASMQRGVSVTNQVGVNTTGSNTLTNTGNPGPATTIDIQSSDVVSPEVISDNLGNLNWFGSNGSGTMTQLLKLTAGANPKVLLAAAAILTEIAGILQVDGTSTFTGAATFNSGVAINGSGTCLTVAEGSQFNGDARFTGAGTGLQVDNNLHVLGNVNGDNSGNFNGASYIAGNTLNSGGITSAGGVAANQYSLSGGSGNYGLYQGSISRISTGTFVSTGAAQTITHDLGAVPSFVLMQCDDSGPSTTTHSAYAYTSTTFKAFVYNASVTIRWVCLRF